jgi:hypothetical protein
MAEEFKNLPPQERLKKLKELEKKKKQELEDAAKEIKDSEDEITERQKWIDKVPIPEVATENLEGLGEEGKDLVKTLRGVKSKVVEEPLEQKKLVENLEDTVEQEAGDLPPELQAQIQYGQPGQLAEIQYGTSDRPLNDLYQEAVQLKDSIQQKGYISSADEKKAEYLSGVVQERMQSAEEGSYSFTEQTARAASITKQLAAGVSNAYQSHTPIRGNDWYKS